MNGGDICVEDDSWEASGLGFTDAIEGGGNAAIGGEHIAEAIQYRVKVLESNGEVRSFFLDAVTFQIVRVE